MKSIRIDPPYIALIRVITVDFCPPKTFPICFKRKSHFKESIRPDEHLESSKQDGHSSVDSNDEEVEFMQLTEVCVSVKLSVIFL